jgi:hypothetical protein
MEYSQEIPLELFQTFINIFKKNGAEGTMKILNKGKKDIEIEDSYVQSVLEVVASEFSMDLNDILYDKYVRGENKYAIGFCIYYLYKD